MFGGLSDRLKRSRGEEGRFQARPKPEFLSHGEPARLIPVDDHDAFECKLTSAFLAVLESVPDFAEAVLEFVDGPSLKAEALHSFREVTFKDIESNKRPDGLVIIDDPKAPWSALLEAKVNLFRDNEAGLAQLCAYQRIANELDIDRLLTISTLAPHSPIRKEIEQVAWSLARPAPEPLTWMMVHQLALNLLDENRVRTAERRFILEEYVRFMHFFARERKTGRRHLRVNSLGGDWPRYLKTLKRKKNNQPEPGLEKAVLLNWRTAVAFLAGLLTERAEAANCLPATRHEAVNPSALLAQDRQTLAKLGVLEAVFRPANQTGTLTMTLNLLGGELSFSLKRPVDDMLAQQAERGQDAEALGQMAMGAWLEDRVLQEPPEGMDAEFFEAIIDLGKQGGGKRLVLSPLEVRKRIAQKDEILARPLAKFAEVALTERYKVVNIVEDPNVLMLKMAEWLTRFRFLYRRLLD